MQELNWDKPSRRSFPTTLIFANLLHWSFHPVEPEADYHTECGGQPSLRGCSAHVRRSPPLHVFCSDGDKGTASHRHTPFLDTYLSVWLAAAGWWLMEWEGACGQART